MKLYIKLACLIIGMIILFGFLCPYLISSTSTELVIIGILLIIAGIQGCVFLIISILKDVPKIKESIQKFFVDFKNKITKE